MALRALSLLGLLAATVLAGCTADGGADLGAVPPGSAAEGANAGSPASHGDAERTEAAVTLQRQGDWHVARQTLTFANDFGGASAASVRLETGAGGVTTRAWSEGGYRTVVLLEARADTEAEAREWLGKLTVTHTDRLSGGRLALATVVDYPDGPRDGVSLSGTVTATLPEEPSYDIDLLAGSGGAVSTGLGGPSISADTGSGGISIEGAFARIEADTGSGGIELDATVNSVVATAGSGGVAARLRAGGSGLWSFQAGSGGVAVDVVRGAGDAFDVEADVGSGSLAVSLSDGEPVGEQTEDHAHVRSSGYGSASIQVRLQADTGSGGIAIAD